MSKKIVIVEPKSPNKNVFSRARALPLLGPVYLATMLHNEGHEVSIINENITSAMRNGVLCQSIVDADILMVSGMTSTAPRGYTIADQFKKEFPDKRVIMGGSHTSFMPKEALEHADSIVVGEAEPVINQAISGQDGIIMGSPVKDLNDLPTADLSLIFQGANLRRLPISTSRGCPFGCTFCSVTKMFGHQYRFRSSENVINDIKSYDPKRIFFYDDNFTANPARSKDLMKNMYNECGSINWDAQARVDVARDPELISLMAKSGCHKLYIGFESINPNTLKKYNKAQSVEDIQSSIRTLHDNGISVHGMFVIGSEDDDTMTARQTADFCDQHDIDTAQFFALTPQPGTDTYNDYNSQNRIITKNWKFYDGQHVVFKPRLMSPIELQEGIIYAMKDFYALSKGMKLAIKDSLRFSYKTAKTVLLAKKQIMPDMANMAYKFFGSKIIKIWEQENYMFINRLRSYSQKHYTNVI